MSDIERRLNRLEAIAEVTLSDGLCGVQALEIAHFDGNTDAFLKSFGGGAGGDEWAYKHGYLEAAGLVLGSVGFQDCQRIMECMFPWESEPRYLYIAPAWPDVFEKDDTL